MVRSPYATRLTLFGERDMTNRKGFRNGRQKAIARERAEVVKGTHVCPVNTPISYHKADKFQPSAAQIAHYANYLSLTAA